MRCIAIAGDISMADAMKKIQARLGAWKKTGSPVPTVTDPAVVAQAGHLPRRAAELGADQPARRRSGDPAERIPTTSRLPLLNKVIGGGPTGRLFRNLREAKGYTYGASSFIDAPRFRGTWVASTDVRTEVTEPALTDLLDELRQAREVPIPAKEFADAKRSMIAAFALTLESPQALLEQRDHALPLQPAGGLLGSLSGADQRHHGRRRAGDGEEVSRSVAAADCRRRQLGRRRTRAAQARVRSRCIDAEGRRITTY